MNGIDGLLTITFFQIVTVEDRRCGLWRSEETERENLFSHSENENENVKGLLK